LQIYLKKYEQVFMSAIKTNVTKKWRKNQTFTSLCFTRPRVLFHSSNVGWVWTFEQISWYWYYIIRLSYQPCGFILLVNGQNSAVSTGPSLAPKLHHQGCCFVVLLHRKLEGWDLGWRELELLAWGSQLPW